MTTLSSLACMGALLFVVLGLFAVYVVSWFFGRGEGRPRL